MQRTASLALALATAIFCLSWMSVSAAGDVQAPERPGRPNIVLLVADDMGYGDVGAFGGSIPTPNIDAIASAGVRFTSGYVAAPVCAPSRAALLTGRYPQRFGIESNPGENEEENQGLPASELTLGDLLRKQGYKTGLIGKWHLGETPATHPNQRGFDEFYGFLRAAYPQAPEGQRRPPSPEEVAAAAAGRQPHPAGRSLVVYRNTDRADDPGYPTDAWSREALAFIDRHRADPFFLYVAFNAPHVPLHATEKYLARFSREPDARRRTYFAMVSALDDAVGAITNKLRETGLEQNTVVLFLSDNGCSPEAPCSTGPLEGAKFTHSEGGVRVPFVMRWPAAITPATVFHEPVSALDVLPTVAAAAGAALPDDRVFDGIDLRPFLAGQRAGAPHEALFWRLPHRGAVRKGDWKLLIVRRLRDPTREREVNLFNLSTDVAERHNQAPAHPEIVGQLRQALLAWEAQLPPPPGLPARPPAAKPPR